MPQPLFSRFPALSTLDHALKQKIVERASVVTIPVNESLFQSGGNCDDYLLVLDGVLRVCLFSENGREIVLYRVRAGQTCFLTTSCLLTSEPYTAEGVVEEEISAVLLPAALFRELMATSAEFRNFVFFSCGKRISKLMQLIETVAFERIDLRLSRFLVKAAEQGSTLETTHEQIASELGTAREVVSRQLKAFENKGWIDLKRNRVIILDKAALITAQHANEVM